MAEGVTEAVAEAVAEGVTEAVTEGVAEGVKPETIPVIDYEGSQYRSDFWEGQGRQYEDAAERLALQQLLPAQGGRIAEIGAGFGRLADLYGGYDQVLLFDYSRTLLEEAAREWGKDPRFVFVAGNLYSLPLASGCLDSLVMVRVMHHVADVSAALAQLRRVVHRHGVGVLEYANKRNLKAILRWMLRRQSWSPWQRDPVEFVELNFDFHPEWMGQQLRTAGWRVDRRCAVSHFRLPQLKERVAPARLAAWDSQIFGLGGTYPLAPSVFVKVTPVQGEPRAPIGTGEDALVQLLRCPSCSAESFVRLENDRIECGQCCRHFARRAGVWDLKECVA